MTKNKKPKNTRSGFKLMPSTDFNSKWNNTHSGKYSNAAYDLLIEHFNLRQMYLNGEFPAVVTIDQLDTQAHLRVAELAETEKRLTARIYELENSLKFTRNSESVLLKRALDLESQNKTLKDKINGKDLDLIDCDETIAEERKKNQTLYNALQEEKEKYKKLFDETMELRGTKFVNGVLIDSLENRIAELERQVRFKNQSIKTIREQYVKTLEENIVLKSRMEEVVKNHEVDIESLKKEIDRQRIIIEYLQELAITNSVVIVTSSQN